MQNSGETENELRPFLQRHDRPILERQRQGRLLLISISGSGGCDAFSPSAHRSSPVSGGGGSAGAVAESGEARFREVPASAHHLLHVPLRMTSVAHQGLDGDDALALLPAIVAQSSGLLVFGRSSFSLSSSRTAATRSSVTRPFPPPPMQRLRASFFARRTTDSIIAPETKSLKWRTSFSPLAYALDQPNASVPLTASCGPQQAPVGDMTMPRQPSTADVQPAG